MNLAARKQFAEQYAHTYVDTAVSEAGPHKLVEMLYDNALKQMKLAKIFIEQKDYEKKARHINNALSSVMLLRDGLNPDKGGEIAQNLDALYSYCYRRIMEASVENNVSILDEVTEYIQDLKSAWLEMPEAYKKISKEKLNKMDG